MGNAGFVCILRTPASGQHSAADSGSGYRLHALSVPRGNLRLPRCEDLLDKLLPLKDRNKEMEEQVTYDGGDGGGDGDDGDDDDCLRKRK